MIHDFSFIWGCEVFDKRLQTASTLSDRCLVILARMRVAGR